MKTDRIPDIYIEQYLLDELPDNLRKEMEDLILKDPELNSRIAVMKKSNEEILSAYPAKSMAEAIIKKCSLEKTGALSYNMANAVKSGDTASEGIISSLKRAAGRISSAMDRFSERRFTLSIAASAVAMIAVLIVLIPGVIDIRTPADNDVRIKGLDSKLLIYRMKGKEIEELQNYAAAGKGDIIQVGYIAAGNFKHGVILSIDGRGSVTLHLPDSGSADQELVLYKKILLDKSYELDDSPSFERFIMVLSPDPLNAADLVERAKKLAISRDSAQNGSIISGNNSKELSIIIKKSISGD